ncbi:hypothetical protein CSAL01_13092 [Colletotrichum salicis]|uniref:Uncharacterized protein n=1 Tax=Colletotrichum salicis TaxID=1209931 RepID=A0A135V9G9_9PEZI|nr:hypothetical protein CSAL01_13092 [Colletotrichum salicis]
MPDIDIRDGPAGRLAQDHFLFTIWPLQDAPSDAAHDKELSGIYYLLVITHLLSVRLSIEDRKGPAREAEEFINMFMSLVWHSAGVPELIEDGWMRFHKGPHDDAVAEAEHRRVREEQVSQGGIAGTESWYVDTGAAHAGHDGPIAAPSSIASGDGHTDASSSVAEGG